ncbi:SusE domain-containing protein [Nafulsella turpanensis]|uniref:SusE domain-containing protein n=1 Tax=Nafulsella turpanensis TaxID=1265690 RepID=UPI0003770FEA|nr:SusE domain-containing protein [Nafulsella turpanensis]
MKTIIYNKLTFLGLFLVTLMACEKEEDRVILQPGTAPALSVSTNELILTEEEAETEAISFNWTESDFGYDAAIDYTLQIDTAGGNFAEPVEEALDNATDWSYTVAELNAMAREFGLTPGEAHQLHFRIKAAVSEHVEPAFSNVSTIEVTPYAPTVVTGPVQETIYLIGSATENDWDNTAAMPAFLSDTEEHTFIYTGFLEAGELKFLSELGQWAPQWGSDEAGGVLYRPTEDDPDPAPFEIPADGYYTIVIDTLNLTYSQEPYDASSATSYNTIGIIGAFNDWSVSVPLEQSTFNPHIWFTEYSFEEDTMLKFRANDAWTVNWGAASEPERLFGLGVQDGADIAVPAGDYTIYFNDLTGRYMLLTE